MYTQRLSTTNFSKGKIEGLYLNVISQLGGRGGVKQKILFAIREGEGG